MKTFAIIEDQVVVNVIVAESLEIANEVTGDDCVEYTESNLAHIGLSYDGESFEQPFVEIADVPADSE